LQAGTGRVTVPYGGGGRSRDAAIGPSRRLAARDLRGLRQHARRGSPWGRRAFGRRRPAASRNSACGTLFLEPAHRGRGGGRRLVAHAQALRGGELTVDVNEQNPAARGFYQALGFAVAGRSPLDADGRPFPLLHMRRPAPS